MSWSLDTGALADINYDGDTIPSYVAIITPLGCLALSLFAYEFIIFKSYAQLFIQLAD